MDRAAANANQPPVALDACRVRREPAGQSRPAWGVNQPLFTEQGERAVDGRPIDARILLLRQIQQRCRVHRRACFLDQPDDQAALRGHADAEGNQVTKQRAVGLGKSIKGAD